jgi:uncharacterized metal-binding protein YceD (DUF177 family)
MTGTQSPTRPTAKPAWSVPIAVSDVPETGRHVDLVADAPTRAALAKVASVVDVPRLEASFDLTRQGSDALRVIGQIAATVVQHCVVTLDPVESEINETVDLMFVSRLEAAGGQDDTASQSIDVEEPPELLSDGTVDLGAIATEFLLLSIDPYPRKPGAVFKAPAAAEDPASNPFAALAGLKPDGKR